MNPHFVEILKAFRDEGVEHLVIGAHALAAHGHARATLDIDIWVKPTEVNAGSSADLGCSELKAVELLHDGRDLSSVDTTAGHVGDRQDHGPFAADAPLAAAWADRSGPPFPSNPVFLQCLNVRRN